MRVLVAGVGNIFLGDDGFGVEVAARLTRRPLPEHVRVVDFGIRGLHLAYELLDGVDRLILIDAAQRGRQPGTVSVLRVTGMSDGPTMTPMDAHDMSPDTVLDLVHSLGGSLGEVLVVTCEPEDVGANLGLSDAVLAAVDPAVAAVERLLDDAVRTAQ
ncbi:MAG TPA: hydrogenase maturation protease [Pseudonocardiaceae bacterium]|jgi:hydrogenase maturation protease|nr:hydrogenase maturation protease [Pseudonocardiaceae bacterium]